VTDTYNDTYNGAEPEVDDAELPVDDNSDPGVVPGLAEKLGRLNEFAASVNATTAAAVDPRFDPSLPPLPEGVRTRKAPNGDGPSMSSWVVRRLAAGQQLTGPQVREEYGTDALFSAIKRLKAANYHVIESTRREANGQMLKVVELALNGEGRPRRSPAQPKVKGAKGQAKRGPAPGAKPKRRGVLASVPAQTDGDAREEEFAIKPSMLPWIGEMLRVQGIAEGGEPGEYLMTLRAGETMLLVTVNGVVDS
jgi:hypothetical protein